MSSQRTYKKLGDLVNIRTGKLDANAANEGGEYPFFTCSREPLQIDTYSYDCECVLIAGNGDLNVKYYKGKFDAYQRTYIIEKKPEIDYISTYYIYQFFQEYVKVLRARSIGGIIKYIKLGDLTEAMIPIPETEEQQSIVRELDAISDIIAAKNTQLRELDALAQALFYDIFGDPITNPKGWPVKKLGEYFNIGSSKRVFQSEWRSKGVPFYRAREVVKLAKDGFVDNELFIDEELYTEYAKKYGVPTAGDILVTGVGTLGITYIVKENDRFYYKDGNIICLHKNIDINSLFIDFLFKTPYLRSQIENCSGATVGTYTIDRAKKTEIIVPPLSLQQSFAAKIQAIEAQKTTLRQSIAEFKSLLAQRMDYHFN